MVDEEADAMGVTRCVLPTTLVNARLMTCEQYTSGVRCVVGVGGAVWVDKHRVIHHSHTAFKLCSPDGYRLGITPSQHRIKPTQQNRVVLALQILPTFSTFTILCTDDAISPAWRWGLQ